MLVLDVNCPSFGNICNLNIYFGIGYILGDRCQVWGFCALCVCRVGEFVYVVIYWRVEAEADGVAMCALPPVSSWCNSCYLTCPSLASRIQQVFQSWPRDIWILCENYLPYEQQKTTFNAPLSWKYHKNVITALQNCLIGRETKVMNTWKCAVLLLSMLRNCSHLYVILLLGDEIWIKDLKERQIYLYWI